MNSLQEFKEVIQQFSNEKASREVKQKALMRAINSQEHFRNMVRNNDEKIKTLCSLFQLREYNRKDVIFRNHQPVKEVYWILEGQISCWDKKTEQDINTEMKLNGLYEQFVTNNNMSKLSKDQLFRLQNIKIRLNFLRDLELDQMIREIDTENQFFILNNICTLKRARFLEAGEIAGENCAISGMKYDGLCVVNSDKCYVLALPTEDYTRIFNMNKDIFYFIKDTLISIFGFSNQKLITRLAYQFEVMQFNYNQVIYSEGDVADCVYIIKSGEVEIVKSIDIHDPSQLQYQPTNKQNELQQNQNQSNASEVNPSLHQNGYTHEALAKQNPFCEFSKYKRKIKPKVMETQIVLKNCGILGLEDYEVEGVAQVQPSKDLEHSSQIKKKNDEKSNPDHSIRSHKLRYVKAISKSNDTVLLRIRDKYIDTLLKEQGINRQKISENLKIQKQQYHNERLQKIHELKKQNASSTNSTGQSGNLPANVGIFNNYYANNTTHNNNNTINNNPPTIFSTNPAINFNISKDLDEGQKNLQFLRRHEKNQSSTYFPQAPMKSQALFTVALDKKISQDSTANPSFKTISYDVDEQQQTPNEKMYSSTPLAKPLCSRSSNKNLSQIDLKFQSYKKYSDELNSAEPTPTVYSRVNNKRYTDFSATSTATTASLNSMQKLSPILSLPINSCVKTQSGQKQYPTNSCNSSIMNSPLTLGLEDKQTSWQEKPRSQTKSMAEFLNLERHIVREENSPSSPMPHLHPIVAAEKHSNLQHKILQEVIPSNADVKDTNILYNQISHVRMRNSQSLQNMNSHNHLQPSNASSTRHDHGSPAQKAQLDLLFLLPEKTRILNQKRMMRQDTMLQQKGATPKVQDCCKKKVNFCSSGEGCQKTGSSIGQKGDICLGGELEYQQQQQQLSIQEYLPEKLQNSQHQGDQKIFINRLKGIHPILKKCRTLAFTDEEVIPLTEDRNQRNQQQQQEQQLNQEEFTHGSSSRRQYHSKSQKQTNTGVQIKESRNNSHENNQIISHNDSQNINNITCTPLLNALQIPQQKSSPLNCFKLNSSRHITIPDGQSKNCSNNNNQNNHHHQMDNSKTPMSVISYSKQNAVHINPGYQPIKQKNSNAVQQQRNNKNAVELLRRSTLRATKNCLLSIQQSEFFSKSMQMKNESLVSICQDNQQLLPQSPQCANKQTNTIFNHLNQIQII